MSTSIKSLRSLEHFLFNISIAQLQVDEPTISSDMGIQERTLIATAFVYLDIPGRSWRGRLKSLSCLLLSVVPGTKTVFLIDTVLVVPW
jgi:hypothetical protein